MDENTEYYRQNARSFFDSTVAVDMSALHAPFLAKLPAQAHILDAGCGSGRDAKAFSDLGHQVSAFDASPDLASLASEHCGFEVAVHSFSDVAQGNLRRQLVLCQLAPRPAGRKYLTASRGCGAHFARVAAST